MSLLNQILQQQATCNSQIYAKNKKVKVTSRKGCLSCTNVLINETTGFTLRKEGKVSAFWILPQSSMEKD